MVFPSYFFYFFSSCRRLLLGPFSIFPVSIIASRCKLVPRVSISSFVRQAACKRRRVEACSEFICFPPGHQGLVRSTARTCRRRWPCALAATPRPCRRRGRDGSRPGQEGRAGAARRLGERGDEGREGRAPARRRGRRRRESRGRRRLEGGGGVMEGGGRGERGVNNKKKIHVRADLAIHVDGQRLVSVPHQR